MVFDTSVYGRILEQKDEREILDAAKRKRGEVVVKGVDLIKKELRRAGNKKVRDDLLDLYDKIVKEKHTLRASIATKLLANAYFHEYKRNRGAQGRWSMENDFLIVASAVLNNLDVVVSNDERTMLSEPTIKAYLAVNSKHKLKTPEFNLYEEFKKWLIH